MHIDCYFSISNSEKINDAQYVIFGVPYDATQTFKPGSRFAPNAIREASWNLEEYSCYFSTDLSNVRAYDAGNISCDGSFEEISQKIRRLIEKVKGVSIALGGEHTISYSTVKSLTEKHSDICYVVFDAHFDLRNEFDSSRFSHACNLRRVLDLGLDAVLVGVRSGTGDEVEFARKSELKHLFAWEIVKNGFEAVRSAISNSNKIYISLDLDVFDPAFAPGVSTPEPFGLQPTHFLQFLSEFVVGESERVVGFDVVEVIPDSQKVTQTLAAKLIFEFMAAMERDKEE